MQCVKCKLELPEGAVYCYMCGKKQSVTKRKRRKGYNGGGSVTKLLGNRRNCWVARGPSVRVNGKMVRPYVGTFETESEAWEAIAAQPGAILNDKHNITLEEAFEVWRKAHYPTLKSDSGKAGYDGAWKHIPLEMRSRKMRELRTEDFQEPINILVTEGRSKSLCEKVRQLGSQLCQWAMDNDLIQQNYASKVKIPDIPCKKSKREFTEDEISRIYSYRDDPEHWEIARIVLCWIYTGTRSSELLLIKSDQVYLQKGYMIGGVKTEAGKNRIIPIHPIIRPFIEIWYDLGGEYLISNYRGTKCDYAPVRKRFYWFMECLGIENVEPRTGRRSCATALSRAGVRPEVISRLLGHTEYDTTEIYIMNNLQDLLLANAAIPVPLVTNGNESMDNK